MLKAETMKRKEKQMEVLRKFTGKRIVQEFSMMLFGGTIQPGFGEVNRVVIKRQF